MRQILKTKLLLFLLILLGQSAFSQDRVGHVTLLKKNGGVSTATAGKSEGIGHVTLLRKNAALVYLGGGLSNPNSTTKEAGVVKGIDFNLSVYKPIWYWDKSNLSLGINAGGGITNGNGDYNLDGRYTVYNLQGQSAPPVVVAKGSGSPKAQGFKFEGGPQLNIHMGGVTLSPIFNVGYLSLTQKSLTVTETVQENTIDYSYDLLTQKETKTSGLGVLPKVRLAYNITPRIGIWVEGSYLMGPSIKTESTRFMLDPTIPSDSYNLGHFQEGQYVATKTETKYSALGINGGIVIGLGTPGKGKPVETASEGSPSKEEVLTNDGETNSFSWRMEKKQDQEKDDNCLIIQSPKNGSQQNVNEPLKISIKMDEKKAQSDPTITIYKISNDKNYWYKKENLNQLLNANDFMFKTNGFEKEAKETGFAPIALKSKQNGNQLESTIDKGKLSEGAYKIVVNGTCGASSSNFMMSSGAITTVSLTTNCKQNFGDYSYTFVVKNTGTNAINTTTIPAFSSPTGTLSGFTIAPALPIVIAAGGTQVFTGSFSYSGSYTGNILATVSGHQVGNPAYTSSDTEPGELKACICDYCEKEVEFDYDQAPAPTYNATNNSIHITQALWDMAGKPLVGVKAEIIGFERTVGAECMKCDKNSNQWGNFIGGNSGSTVGSFTSANDGGVTGNTHHSIYFYPSNSYKYDMDIAIPPLSTLSCCCDKIRIKIRYTHIFKEANGECKMCSSVFEYEFTQGTCPKQPTTPNYGDATPWQHVTPIKNSKN